MVVVVVVIVFVFVIVIDFVSLSFALRSFTRRFYNNMSMMNI